MFSDAELAHVLEERNEDTASTFQMTVVSALSFSQSPFLYTWR
jgi:hypothetical protein